MAIFLHGSSVGKGPLTWRDSSGGVSALQRRSSVLQRSDDNGVTWVPLAGPVGTIDAGTTGASLLAAVAKANAAGGNQTILVGAGVIDCKAAMSFTTDGNTVLGMGPYSSFLNANDAGGLAGADLFTCSGLGNTFANLQFTASAQRTAGNYIKVLGKNAISNAPAQQVGSLFANRILMRDGFKGITLNNNAGVTAGCWGSRIDSVAGYNFGANGIYIDVDSTLGGQTQITNCEFHGPTGLADAARASAGIRYRGGADIEIYNVTAVYLQNGFLSDPTAGNAANVILIGMGDWDNMSRDAVKIGGNGGTSTKVEIMGGWHQTVQTAGGINLANVNDVAIIGANCWANSVGIVLNGVVRANVVGNDCSSSTIGIQATGVTTDFVLYGNVVGIAPGGATPTTGITVGGSCDHLNIDGNILRQATAPLTVTPALVANRVVVGLGNITA